MINEKEILGTVKALWKVVKAADAMFRHYNLLDEEGNMKSLLDTDSIGYELCKALRALRETKKAI